MAGVFETVASVMARFGIPEYIWRPILELESGGDPYARAVTPREDSRGLFQINVVAHPQYATTNLYDPAVNAEIAARDFLLPAFSAVRDVPDPAAQAAYVYREGIRPQWTADLDARVRARAVELASQQKPIIPGGEIRAAPPEDAWTRFWRGFSDFITRRPKTPSLQEELEARKALGIGGQRTAELERVVRSTADLRLGGRLVYLLFILLLAVAAYLFLSRTFQAEG